MSAWLRNVAGRIRRLARPRVTARPPQAARLGGVAPAPQPVHPAADTAGTVTPPHERIAPPAEVDGRAALNGHRAPVIGGRAQPRDGEATARQAAVLDVEAAMRQAAVLDVEAAMREAAALGAQTAARQANAYAETAAQREAGLGQHAAGTAARRAFALARLDAAPGDLERVLRGGGMAARQPSAAEPHSPHMTHVMPSPPDAGTRQGAASLLGAGFPAAVQPWSDGFPAGVGIPSAPDDGGEHAPSTDGGGRQAGARIPAGWDDGRSASAVSAAGRDAGHRVHAVPEVLGDIMAHNAMPGGHARTGSAGDAHTLGEGDAGRREHEAQDTLWTRRADARGRDAVEAEALRDDSLTARGDSPAAQGETLGGLAAPQPEQSLSRSQEHLTSNADRSAMRFGYSGSRGRAGMVDAANGGHPQVGPADVHDGDHACDDCRLAHGGTPTTHSGDRLAFMDRRGDGHAGHGGTVARFGDHTAFMDRWDGDDATDELSGGGRAFGARPYGGPMGPAGTDVWTGAHTAFMDGRGRGHVAHDAGNAAGKRSASTGGLADAGPVNGEAVWGASGSRGFQERAGQGSAHGDTRPGQVRAGQGDGRVADRLGAGLGGRAVAGDGVRDSGPAKGAGWWPRLASEAAQVPDEVWPELLDDAHLWTVTAPVIDERRIERLEREQGGVPWNG